MCSLQLAGYDYCYVEAAYGELAVVSTSQLAWLVSHGTNGERIGALVCQWTACEHSTYCSKFLLTRNRSSATMFDC